MTTFTLTKSLAIGLATGAIQFLQQQSRARADLVEPADALIEERDNPAKSFAGKEQRNQRLIDFKDLGAMYPEMVSRRLDRIRQRFTNRQMVSQSIDLATTG